MMKRLIGWAAIGLFVAACSPQGAPETAATPNAPTATSLPLPAESAGPVAPTPTPQPITREQVVQPQPDDWVRGPDTAAVTFIEWGDFQ